MKLSVKILLFLAMLIVPADYSLAEEVSTPTINTEAPSVKNQNFSKASTGRKYALTNDYLVYLRSGRSEYAQIYWVIPKYSALLVLDEQEKWYRVRFFDEGKQLEGWILDSNVIIYVEEYYGEFDELIKQGVIKLKKITIEREEKRRRQEIDALEIKNRETSDSDYKGKLAVYEELSRIDVQNKFKHQDKADFYRDKLNQQIKDQEEHARVKQEEQANLERIKRISQLIGAKVYVLNMSDFRTEPMWNGEHIFTASCGAVFTIISVEKNDSWYRVKALNGKEGYLAAEWVTTDASIIEKKKSEEYRQKKQEEKDKKERLNKIEQAKNKRLISLMKKHPSWSAMDCQTILAGEVRIGMNMEQCKEAWGKPSGIHNTTFAHGTHSQWCYGDYCSNALYFEKGILTAIQN